MEISSASASAVFRQAAQGVAAGADPAWAAKVERLSQLCIQGKAATHIAFLGVSMLAKATAPSVDLRAIKPDHAPGNPRAYSARTLCHGVLVPLASEFNVHIGVTGREPMNNQPYFRMKALGDGTPVHKRSAAAFDYVCSLVDELSLLDAAKARSALGAFVAVRQGYWPKYTTGSGNLNVSYNTLAARIDELVRAGSEGGAVAQAAAAGLLDVFAGDGRVESGRVNDPSRHYPGDVCVTNETDDGRVVYEKAFEVRDKPVSASDVHVFCGTCAAKGVREAAILMVSPHQPRLDDVALRLAAEMKGIGLTLFYGWQPFVEQVLFWAAAPQVLASLEATDRIESRLIAVEASPAAVQRWQTLIRA